MFKRFTMSQKKLIERIQLSSDNVFNFSVKRKFLQAYGQKNSLPTKEEKKNQNGFMLLFNLKYQRLWGNICRILRINYRI